MIKFVLNLSVIYFSVLFFQLVELLLKHGANPLQTNSEGKSPLDVAASPEMVKILKREIISSGSDSSSIEDTRSPMSQDSINSMKDDDRSLDIDGELLLFSSDQITKLYPSLQSPTVLTILIYLCH